MLKITQGLNPLAREGVSIYTVGTYNTVRVKTEDEDFCITAHDYARGSKYTFAWDDAMESLKEDDLTLFTKKQARLYHDHLDEINDMLKEIDGDELIPNWYWTSAEYNPKMTWTYYGGDEDVNHVALYKSSPHKVRPVLNL